MKRLIPVLISLLILSLYSCWDRQDISVNPIEMPRYDLWGQLVYQEDNMPVKGASIEVIQLEVYQGDYIEPQTVISDSLGFYRIDSLFRGKYAFSVKISGLELYQAFVGIINFEDREYNISLPRAIQLGALLLSIEEDMDIVGLTSYEGSPSVILRSGKEEFLKHEETVTDITPSPHSYWQHNSLVYHESLGYTSIRRQIDTTFSGNQTYVSAPRYYYTFIEPVTGEINPSDISVQGSSLTRDTETDGFWVITELPSGQRFLEQRTPTGDLLSGIPFAANQAKVNCINQVSTGYFRTLDTNSALIWVATLSDSLYGQHLFHLFDAEGNLIIADYDFPEFLISHPSDPEKMLLSNSSGVWEVDILSHL